MFKKLKNLKLLEVIVFVLSLTAFLFNARYVSYPDEFVNLLAGKSILQGGIPYRDFFDHHLPLAWYLSSILLVFSFQSYVIFRLLWSIFSFVLLLVLGLYLKKHYSRFYPFYLIFFAFYPLLAVYFWFHLFLADSLAVLFFSLIFWLLLVQTIEEKINFRLLLLTSFLTFCLVFSSMTFSYLAIILYLWELYLVFRDNKKNIVKFLFFAFAPYFLYFLYLLITGTLYDFYFSNFVYNTKLYISIPNYVKGRFFNPIKFGLTLIDNFYQGYLPLLSKIKHLDLYLPIDTTAALGSLVLLLFFLWKKPAVGFLFFLALSFSAPRSYIGKYSETDYQASLFYVFGLISALSAWFYLYHQSFKEKIFDDLKRLTHLVLSILIFFSFIFLLNNFYHKFFQVYTQKMPTIPNRSFAADFVETLIDRGDYFWIGPYEPHHEFFVKKGKLPGKYPTLLPQFREDEYLKSSFLSQFEKNPPAIVIFKHESSIFATPADEFGRFFLDWMENRYVAIEKIKGVEVLKSPSEFNLRTDLYLLKEKEGVLLQRLRDFGYIK
jgi:hypothetical protein